MSNQNFLILMALVWCGGGIIAAGIFEPPKDKWKFAVAFFFLGPVFWIIISLMWLVFSIKKLARKIGGNQ
jgi:hypothetical protein